MQFWKDFQDPPFVNQVETDYRIVSVGNQYGGVWNVVRVADKRIMTSSQHPFGCSRWVKVWGPLYKVTPA